MTKHLTKPIRAFHFLVLAFLMTVGTQVSADVRVCKKTQKEDLKSTTKDTYAKEWKRDCSDPKNPKFVLYNHTQGTVQKVEVINPSGEIVYHESRLSIKPQRRVVMPWTSMDSRPLFCTGDNITIKMRYRELIYTPEKCLEYYSQKELMERDEKNRIQKMRNTIRDNCVIAKSENATNSAIAEIRRVCTAISENPSFLQKFRWGP